MYFYRCRSLNQDEIAKGYCLIINFNNSQENDQHILFSSSFVKQFKFVHVFNPEENQGNHKQSYDIFLISSF